MSDLWRRLDRWPGHHHDDPLSRWLWRLVLACMLVAIVALAVGVVAAIAR